MSRTSPICTSMSRDFASRTIDWVNVVWKSSRDSPSMKSFAPYFDPSMRQIDSTCGRMILSTTASTLPNRLRIIGTSFGRKP